MGFHTSQTPVVQAQQAGHHQPQLFRVLDTYGRTPAPPAASMVLNVGGLPVAWFTDDQVAAILYEHLERQARGGGR